MKKHTILVTGGAGFIGSHVVDELIKSGHRVVVLDDLSGGYKENVNLKAQFVKGRITDNRLINKLFKKHSFEYVFHIAAYAAEGLSHFIRKFNYENNLIGSINIINASINHKVRCLVFTSSIAVYGANQLPMHEDMTPTPEDPYGIAKLTVEQDLKAAHEMFGLNSIVFRPHNVYGERQNIADRYRNVLGIFMNQIRHRKPLSIFGDGKQQRAFTHIADLAPVIAESIFKPKAFNQVFNIGADKPHTINELITIIGKAFGIASPKVKYFPARNEVRQAYADHSKAKKILGYKDAISLEDGVTRMAAWVRQQGVPMSKKFKNIEIQENLPSAWK
ncbi:NAD-dependent epimerase/dehydratase family protein [Candidatus Parcubacteria bacterium]|nr:NAD-dependent epimerase/dehydratase family protein [Candidatus Parcubacteria bacterium]